MKITLCDVTGAIHSSEATDEEIIADAGYTTKEAIDTVVEQMVEQFQDFDELARFNLVINGVKRYFNPRHIVWVAIER